MARKKIMARPSRDKSVSDQLRDFIAARDLTDYQLGQLAGVDPGAIGRFMRREREISGPTFDRLASALGLALVEPAKGRGRPSSHRNEPTPQAMAPRGKIAGDRSEIAVDSIVEGPAEAATGENRDDPAA